MPVKITSLSRRNIFSPTCTRRKVQAQQTGHHFLTMAGWSDWVKYLVSDGKSQCGTACGIYGPSSAQYQIYATVPDNFHVSLSAIRHYITIDAKPVQYIYSVTC